jgi:hypothetical protein
MFVRLYNLQAINRDGEASKGPAELDPTPARQTCAGVMTEFDRGLLEGWKEEIDKVLIFVSIRADVYGCAS